jgi:predicted DNA-binding transcriptional regulator AlpA
MCSLRGDPLVLSQPRDCLAPPRALRRQRGQALFDPGNLDLDDPQVLGDTRAGRDLGLQCGDPFGEVFERTGVIPHSAQGKLVAHQLAALAGGTPRVGANESGDWDGTRRLGSFHAFPKEPAVQQLFTERQAATFLNLSLASFRRRARRGEIPGQIRLGAHTVRYDLEELKRWLDANRTGKASPALTRRTLRKAAARLRKLQEINGYRDLVRLLGQVIGAIAALRYLLAAIINHLGVAQHLLAAVLRLL